jgi:hypothetical protein
MSKKHIAAKHADTAPMKPTRKRTRTSRMSSGKEQADLLRTSEQRYRELKQEFRQELEDVGFISVGSLSTTYHTCGNPNCRCHQDPDKRHGPYHYWTRKVKGRTVTVTLKPAQVPLYRQGIENNRRLENLLQEMRRISAEAISDAANKLIG